MDTREVLFGEARYERERAIACPLHRKQHPLGVGC
jgi:hypothetical protein